MATGEINEALSAINAFGQTLKRNTKQYTAFMDDMESRDFGASSNRALRAQENGIKVLKKTADALEGLQDKTDKLKAENELGTKNSKKTSKELKKLAKDLHKASPKTFTKEMAKSFDSVGDDAASIQSAFNILNNEIKESAKVVDDKTKVDIQQMRQTYKSTQALKDKATALKSTIKGLFTFERGMTAITASLKRSFDQLEYAQQKQIGMYSIIGDGLETTAFKMSLAPEEMQKFVGENKTLFLSMKEDYSGVNDAVHKNVAMMTKERGSRESLNDQLYNLTGSYAGASDLMATSMDILKGFGEKIGLDDIAKETDVMVQQFAKLGRMSNKSTSEIAKMTAKMLSGENVRLKMLKMKTVQERKAYKDGLLKEVERNKMLGISLEASFAIAEKAAGLGDRDVMSRMKESMVLAMAAAQSGMSNQASERLRMLDMNANRTAPEDEEYKKLLGTFGTNLAKIRGSNDEADMHQAAALEQLLKKMPGAADLAKTIAKETELGKGRGTKDPGEKSALQAGPQFLQSMQKTWNKYARPLISDPIVSAIAGAGGIIWDAITGLGGTLISMYGLLKAFGGGGLVSGIAKKVAEVAKGGVARAGSVAGAAKSAGGSLWQKAIELGSKAMQSVKSVGSKALNMGKSILPSLLNVVKNFAKVLMRRLPLAIAAGIGLKLGDLAGPHVRQGIEAIDNKLGTDAWGTVVDTVGKAMYDGTQKFNELTTMISGNPSSIATPAGAIAGAVIADGTAVTAGTMPTTAVAKAASDAELIQALKSQSEVMAKQLEAMMATQQGVTKMNRTMEDSATKQQEALDAQTDMMDENSQFGTVEKKVK